MIRNFSRRIVLDLFDVQATGVVVITTAKLNSTNSELKLCAGSNPAHCVSDICDGENL